MEQPKNLTVKFQVIYQKEGKEGSSIHFTNTRESFNSETQRYEISEETLKQNIRDFLQSEFETIENKGKLIRTIEVLEIWIELIDKKIAPFPYTE